MTLGSRGVCGGLGGLRVKLQIEWRVGRLTNYGFGGFLRIDGLKNIPTKTLICIIFFRYIAQSNFT